MGDFPKLNILGGNEKNKSGLFKVVFNQNQHENLKNKKQNGVILFNFFEDIEKDRKCTKKGSNFILSYCLKR